MEIIDKLEALVAAAQFDVCGCSDYARITRSYTPHSPAARWIASDTLRELESGAVQKRLKK